MEDGDLELTRAKRRSDTYNVINRQKRIAEAMGLSGKRTDQPHRYAKRHALDCGKSNCAVCGNPRRHYKEKTLQEKKFDEAFKASRGTLIDWDVEYE